MEFFELLAMSKYKAKLKMLLFNSTTKTKVIDMIIWVPPKYQVPCHRFYILYTKACIDCIRSV